MAGILRESYILCSKKKKEKKEKKRERIIHLVMDLWSKLKFIYSERTYTHTPKKNLYWPAENSNMELKFNKLLLNVAFFNLLKRG